MDWTDSLTMKQRLRSLERCFKKTQGQRVLHSSGIGFGFGLQDADLGLGFGLLCAGARPSKSFNGNGVESFGESTLAVSTYRTGNCRTYRRNSLTPMESGTTVESLHETNCRLYRPQSRRICAHRSHKSGAEPPVWQKCGRERRQDWIANI
jgi:hypothetical protein